MPLRALLAAVAWANAFAITCDVGDEVSAWHLGHGVYQPANITAITASTTPALIQVDWHDLSQSDRVVQPPNVRKNGDVCGIVVDLLQTFSITVGTPSTLSVTGANLTSGARLLVTSASETCGDLSATQPSAVASPPGAPVGATDLFFYDVMVDSVGTYTLCFWSGQSYSGRGPYDVQSYATELGPLAVTATTATTTTTTTSVVPYSRRRGTSYESALLSVVGSQGLPHEGLTANPAAWNVHHPSQHAATCRFCQRYDFGAVDGNVQRRELNRIEGILTAEPGPPGALGMGCGPASAAAPVAPPSVLLVARGGCSFEAKARAAAAGGYRGLLVADFAADGAVLPDMASPGGATAEAAVPLPVWLLPSAEGEALRVLASADPVVSVYVEDVQRKPRLATALSDEFGVRTYATQ